MFIVNSWWMRWFFAHSINDLEPVDLLLPFRERGLIIYHRNSFLPSSMRFLPLSVLIALYLVSGLLPQCACNPEEVGKKSFGLEDWFYKLIILSHFPTAPVFVYDLRYTLKRGDPQNSYEHSHLVTALQVLLSPPFLITVLCIYYFIHDG